MTDEEEPHPPMEAPAADGDDDRLDTISTHLEIAVVTLQKLVDQMRVFLERK